MWTHRAPVQNVLSVFDLDILLPGFDHWAVRVSPGQAVVKVRMVGPILQFTGNLKRRCLRSRAHIGAEEFAQSQIRVFQFSLCTEEFWPLVGQGHLGSLNIQFTYNPGAQLFLLVLQFFV